MIPEEKTPRDEFKKLPFTKSSKIVNSNNYINQLFLINHNHSSKSNQNNQNKNMKTYLFKNKKENFLDLKISKSYNTYLNNEKNSKSNKSLHSSNLSLNKKKLEFLENKKKIFQHNNKTLNNFFDEDLLSKIKQGYIFYSANDKKIMASSNFFLEEEKYFNAIPGFENFLKYKTNGLKLNAQEKDFKDNHSFNAANKNFDLIKKNILNVYDFSLFYNNAKSKSNQSTRIETNRTKNIFERKLGNHNCNNGNNFIYDKMNIGNNMEFVINLISNIDFINENIFNENAELRNEFSHIINFDSENAVNNVNNQNNYQHKNNKNVGLDNNIHLNINEGSNPLVANSNTNANTNSNQNANVTLDDLSSNYEINKVKNFASKKSTINRINSPENYKKLSNFKKCNNKTKKKDNNILSDSAIKFVARDEKISDNFSSFHENLKKEHISTNNFQINDLNNLVKLSNKAEIRSFSKFNEANLTRTDKEKKQDQNNRSSSNLQSKNDVDSNKLNDTNIKYPQYQNYSIDKFIEIGNNKSEEGYYSFNENDKSEVFDRLKEQVMGTKKLKNINNNDSSLISNENNITNNSRIVKENDMHEDLLTQTDVKLREEKANNLIEFLLSNKNYFDKFTFLGKKIFHIKSAEEKEENINNIFTINNIIGKINNVKNENNNTYGKGSNNNSIDIDNKSELSKRMKFIKQMSLNSTSRYNKNKPQEFLSLEIYLRVRPIQSINNEFNTKYFLELIFNDVTKKDLALTLQQFIISSCQFLHDFKNPLFSINQEICEMKDFFHNKVCKCDKSYKMQFMSRYKFIREMSEFCQAMVSSYENYSKLLYKPKNFNLDYKVFKVRSFLKFFKNFLDLKLKKSNKNIEFIINNDLPRNYILKSDKNKLKQIIINLLSNAEKFTVRGKITMNVESQEIENKNYIKITIEDTGLGMDEMQKTSLFTPFNTQNNGNLNPNGMGLGLIIVKEISSKLGIEIKIDSHIGKGTKCCFYVENLYDYKKKKHKNLSNHHIILNKNEFHHDNQNTEDSQNEIDNKENIEINLNNEIAKAENIIKNLKKSKKDFPELIRQNSNHSSHISKIHNSIQLNNNKSNFFDDKEDLDDDSNSSVSFDSQNSIETKKLNSNRITDAIKIDTEILRILRKNLYVDSEINESINLYKKKSIIDDFYMDLISDEEHSKNSNINLTQNKSKFAIRNSYKMKKPNYPFENLNKIKNTNKLNYKYPIYSNKNKISTNSINKSNNNTLSFNKKINANQNNYIRYTIHLDKYKHHDLLKKLNSEVYIKDKISNTLIPKVIFTQAVHKKSKLSDSNTNNINSLSETDNNLLISNHDFNINNEELENYLKQNVDELNFYLNSNTIVNEITFDLINKITNNNINIIKIDTPEKERKNNEEVSKVQFKTISLSKKIEHTDELDLLDKKIKLFKKNSSSHNKKEEREVLIDNQYKLKNVNLISNEKENKDVFDMKDKNRVTLNLIRDIEKENLNEFYSKKSSIISNVIHAPKLIDLDQNSIKDKATNQNKLKVSNIKNKFSEQNIDIKDRIDEELVEEPSKENSSENEILINKYIKTPEIRTYKNKENNNLTSSNFNEINKSINKNNEKNNDNSNIRLSQNRFTTCIEKNTINFKNMLMRSKPLNLTNMKSKINKLDLLLKRKEKSFNVLIIDDSVSIRSSCKFILMKIEKLKGYKMNIEEADDGFSGLNFIIKNSLNDKKYDLIILDDEMTYLNGTELIKMLDLIIENKFCEKLGLKYSLFDSVVICSANPDNLVNKIEGMDIKICPKPINIAYLTGYFDEY